MDEDKKRLQISVLPSLLSGSISGTVSTMLLQPLDVVKTRLQSYDTRNQNTKPSVVQITRNIIIEEKMRTLWRGLTPSLWRTVPGVSLYFTSIHLLMSSNLGSTGYLHTAGTAFVSRAFVAILLAPFTVVKTRYESNIFHYRSLKQALVQIYQSEGLKGLWSGTSVTVVRDAPYSGLYYMFYTQAKSFKPTDLQEEDLSYILFQLCCGVVSGIAATLFTQPADIIKTRIQLTSLRQNQGALRYALTSIYKDYGLRGYVQGFVPRAMKRTLMSAISWTIYEQITRVLSSSEPSGS